MFPSKNEIPNKLSPEAVILAYPKPDHNKLNITFGAYAQVYIDTTNNTNHITVGEIELRP